MIHNKLNNSLSLNFPSEYFEIVLFSDGSTDGTARVADSFLHDKFRFYSSSSHEGKNAAINKAITLCSGDVIIFSDADALLETNAIIYLHKYFADPSVGGVCGQRVIGESNRQLDKAQSDYIKFDSLLKKWESNLGSITSNDGKLYAFRKNLFQPLPPAATDDLYVCLSIIKQRYRFIFEPKARAFIKLPSRNPHHEIQRRRRIVARSLSGIFSLKELLNPMKYGMFAVRLIINKIVRRCLLLFLLLLFLSSAFLSFHFAIAQILILLQILFYSSALLYWLLHPFSRLLLLKRLSSVSFYFTIGNFGSFLGFLDFIRGKAASKWEPFKADN